MNGPQIPVTLPEQRAPDHFFFFPAFLAACLLPAKKAGKKKK